MSVRCAAFLTDGGDSEDQRSGSSNSAIIAGTVCGIAGIVLVVTVIGLIAFKVSSR